KLRIRHGSYLHVAQTPRCCLCAEGALRTALTIIAEFEHRIEGLTSGLVAAGFQRDDDSALAGVQISGAIQEAAEEIAAVARDQL
ncbi:hypothetical protein, partial [Tistlia consotensis]|uniref:hypothetical protein n=1 Tax=Tistlia consotensis TaxID=1321365 RepID=UPI001C532812